MNNKRKVLCTENLDESTSKKIPKLGKLYQVFILE